MSWRTSKIVVAARNVGRQLGLNDLIAAALSSGGYEARYDEALSSALRAGDCVWDVGANVGYYTIQFARKVGENGLVYAFEPSPENFPRLADACAALDNVRPLQLALGREDGALPFRQGLDELGATSRIVSANDPRAVVVDVRTVSGLIKGCGVKRPNVMKIDVEGFELEVLQGFGDDLLEPSLRALGVEVHFRILNDRGMADAPKLIESLLTQHGFRIAWPDASHMFATRS